MNVAEKYIQDVLDGVIPAGPWIIKAFQRHRRDLETAHERGFHFDPIAAQDVIYFCENFCIPSDRDTPMALMPWQQAIIHIAYGWKRHNGWRRFRRIYIEIAKKNGKTGLAAALSLYHLIADGEESARVFIAATTRKQAGICFKEAVAMRGRSEDLSVAINQSGNEPVLALYTNNLDRLSMMSRDAASEDGAMVSCAILDELHRWDSSAGIYSVLRYGGRTRKQPLMVEITTAGASAGGTTLCWEEREYGTKILEPEKSGIEDDEFCPFIFSMSPDDDWKNPDNWIKANPSMGYLFDHETIQKEFSEAQGKPSALGEFKRFALNIWSSSESENPAIEIEKWDACCRENLADYPDPVRLRKESLERLKGRTCFAGLDLAPKNDTSALVLLFPPIQKGDKWEIIEYFWCPQTNIKARKKRDRVDYDVWADKGFITLTPGNLTDVRFICDRLIEISKQFDLKEIYYDESWSSELVRMLGEQDSSLHQRCVAMQQGYLKVNAPCQEFMRKVLRQDFSHDNNPVMRWQIGNLRWNTQKGTNFIKPDRDRKREKIDGCSSLIMALACATSPENQIKPKKNLWVVTG